MATTNINFEGEQPTDLVLPAEARFYLHTAAKWANFLGILGFIVTGFTALGALYWFVIGGSMMAASTQQAQASGVQLPPMYGALMGVMGSVGGVFTLLYALVLFFLSLYLVRFAGSSKRAVIFSNPVEVTKGMLNLKSLFKLLGIISIIVIALSILGFIFLVIFAIGMASSLHQ